MPQRRRISSPAAIGQLRVNPTIAVLTVVALVVTLAFGGNSIYQAQSEGSNPIPVAEQSVNFGSLDNVVVEDAAIASQGGVPGPKTVKEFTSDTPFSMFALTWTGDQEFASYVRAEAEDGSWGPWYSAAPMDEVGANGKRGTDLIYVEPTDRIQVSVAGVDLGLDETDATSADQASVGNVPEEAPVAGAGINSEAGSDNIESEQDGAAQEPAAEPATESAAAPAAEPAVEAEQEPAATEPAAPAAQEAAPAVPAAEAGNGLAPIASNYGDIQPVADETTPDASNTVENTGPIAADAIEAVLIDPNLNAGLNTGTEGIELTNSTGMPDVISRSAWGANESMRNASYNEPVSAVTVHHTAGSNNYSEVNAPGIVRGIQTYHGSNLGWGDVGYNALVDKYGNIYEGRAGGLDRAVQGAHVGGFNGNTWGVSVLGNYETAQPSYDSLEAVGELAGWKAAISGFDPNGSDYHQAEFSFGGSKYPAGQGATFPNINAHRDFHYNACPGGNLYREMDTIRDIAGERYNAIYSGTIGDGGYTPSDPTTDPSTPNNPGDQGDQGDQGDGGKSSSELAGNDDTNNSGPASGTPTALLSSALDGDTLAILTIAGSLAVVLLAAGAAQGMITGEATTLGDIEVYEGLTVSELAPIVDGVVSMSGESEISQVWNSVYNVFGDVLGKSQGGVGQTAPVGSELSSTAFALFENGIIVSDNATGTHALWGAMADAWAGQGFDVGPLGMPTSNPENTGNGDELRVDFEGGSIVYDPNTNQVHINTN